MAKIVITKVKLPFSIHKAVKMIAISHDTTISQFLSDIIMNHLNREERK